MGGDGGECAGFEYKSLLSLSFCLINNQRALMSIDPMDCKYSITPEDDKTAKLKKNVRFVLKVARICNFDCDKLKRFESVQAVAEEDF